MKPKYQPDHGHKHSSDPRHGTHEEGGEPVPDSPWLHEPARSKMDPALIVELLDLDRHDTEPIRKKGPGESWGVFYVPVLLRVLRPCAFEAPVGCRVTCRVGDIVACTASRDALLSLTVHPDVLSIEGSRRRGPVETSRSLKSIGALKVHNPPTSELGDHALVGIIEDGVDVLHHAFRDDAGTATRILYLWDQTDTSGPGPGTGLNDIDTVGGTLYTDVDINTMIGLNKVPKPILRDPHNKGHGTHVASIAAGRDTPKFTGGVAPAAGLLVVLPRVDVNKDDPKTLGYSNSPHYSLGCGMVGLCVRLTC